MEVHEGMIMESVKSPLRYHASTVQLPCKHPGGTIGRHEGAYLVHDYITMKAKWKHIESPMEAE